jgi:hypothetical protein
VERRLKERAEAPDGLLMQLLPFQVREGEYDT